MEIIKAEEAQLDELMRITAQAVEQLRNMGIDQWQHGYPNREVWAGDINAGVAHAAVDDGRVLGAFSFFTSPEPSYSEIDGAWLSGAPYASVHRVCVAAECRRRGVAGAMLAYCAQLARSCGLASLRIDTHRDNLPMQRTVARAGFQRCGVIRLADGVEKGRERIAFELML